MTYPEALVAVALIVCWCIIVVALLRVLATTERGRVIRPINKEPKE